VPVTVYEAAGHAGGRCRSFHDATLNRTIDNGNHLVLSGNRAVFDYMTAIGAVDRVTVGAPVIPFLDLATGLRWAVRPDAGRIPWSWLSAARRVPGTSFADYWRSRKLMNARDDQAVGQVIPTEGPLWSRFWAPVIVAVMNTPPAEAAAGPMGRVVRETLAVGAAACRPVLFDDGLDAALVAPAVAFIEAGGGEVRTNARVRGLRFDGDRVDGLTVGADMLDLEPADAVISALSPSGSAQLLPTIEAPVHFSPIVNGHFRLATVDNAVPPVVGLVGGTADWLFRRGDVVSVTVSAADDLADAPAEAVAHALWADVAAVYGLDPAAPAPSRIIKEKRATFRQTPADMRRRPGSRTRWRNLALAGDWTDTGLPATIEGAVRSGDRAAADVLDIVR